jgi:hypothetical protein
MAKDVSEGNDKFWSVENSSEGRIDVIAMLKDVSNWKHDTKMPEMP